MTQLDESGADQPTNVDHGAAGHAKERFEKPQRHKEHNEIWLRAFVPVVSLWFKTFVTVPDRR